MLEHSIEINWARRPSTDDLENLGYAVRDAALARGVPAKRAAVAMKEAIFRKAPIFCAGNLIVKLDGQPIEQVYAPNLAVATDSATGKSASAA